MAILLHGGWIWEHKAYYDSRTTTSIFDFSLDVIDDCMGQVLRGSQNLKESKDYKSDILRSDVNEQFEYENENDEEIISKVSFGSEELGNFSDLCTIRH